MLRQHTLCLDSTHTPIQILTTDLNTLRRRDPRLGHPLCLSPISSYILCHSLIQKPSQDLGKTLATHGNERNLSSPISSSPFSLISNLRKASQKTQQNHPSNLRSSLQETQRSNKGQKKKKKKQTQNINREPKQNHKLLLSHFFTHFQGFALV